MNINIDLSYIIFIDIHVHIHCTYTNQISNLGCSWPLDHGGSQTYQTFILTVSWDMSHILEDHTCMYYRVFGSWTVTSCLTSHICCNWDSNTQPSTSLCQLLHHWATPTCSASRKVIFNVLIKINKNDYNIW